MKAKYKYTIILCISFFLYTLAIINGKEDIYYNYNGDIFKSRDSIHYRILNKVIDSLYRLDQAKYHNKNIDYIDVDYTSFIINREPITYDNRNYHVYSFSFIENSPFIYDNQSKYIGLMLINHDKIDDVTYHKILFPVTQTYIWDYYNINWHTRVLNDSTILYSIHRYSGYKNLLYAYDEYFILNDGIVNSIGRITRYSPWIFVSDGSDIIPDVERKRLGNLEMTRFDTLSPVIHYYYEIDTLYRDENRNVINKGHYYEEYVLSMDTIILNRKFSEEEFKALFDGE